MIYRGPVRPVDAINPAGYSFQQLNSLFSNVKLISGYVRAQSAARRDAYRAQVNEFATAAKNLTASAAAVTSLPAQADAKTEDTVRKAVGDFNRLTNSLRQADTLTTKGRGLDSALQAAAAVREKDLNAIGIAYNRESGELTVDDLKLKQAVAQDYNKVKETLGGDSGFGKAVEAAVRPTSREPVGDYLAYPAPASASGYTRQLGSTSAKSYNAAYSRGLLLDLMA